MEKKGVRSGQPSSKGICSDSKKNQDNANGKLWPRGGRRREPVGTSFSAKCETRPKPNLSQRIDKRPRPRGSSYYGSGQVGGKEETWLVDQDAELGSVFVQGSKKQSLNHLLNFHYTPRENHVPYAYGKSSNSHRWLSTQKHKYNKEQFLQANCQFVVNSNGNYTAYLNSPDNLVNWDFIEQINVQVLDFPSCPICLYEPVAAKITRCGHIYCWSCMLHYLALSDKSWRKCPICFEAIHKNDLKTVVPIPHSAFNVGQQITFRLMRRGKGSLTPTPVDANGSQIHHDETSLLSISAGSNKTMFSKLLIANNNDIFAIIEREKKQLQTQLLEDENAPEKCFIEQALELLSERRKDLESKSSGNELNVDVNNDIEKLQLNLEYTNDVENRMKRNHLESLSSEGLGSEDFNGSVADPVDMNTCFMAEDLDIAPKESSETGAVPSKYFYFYQALDGQHIYLHALNVRMLEHTYGSLEFCPTSICGKIVEKESGSMTEELRNRLRYLQHLPITCQFEVAEIHLKTPIVTNESLDYFHDQVENRKRKRQRRAREEKRREKRIAEEENKQMGKYPEMRASIDSRYQFPEFSAATIADMPPLTGNISPDLSERSASPTLYNEDVAGACQQSSSSGPSFAKMLATSKPTPPLWPVLNKSKANEIPRRLINVTGSGQPATSGMVQRARRNSDSDPEPDGYVPAPAYNQSFSDAIAMALQKATISAEDAAKEDSIGATSGKKKKKKVKQKVLFATSMAYSG